MINIFKIGDEVTLKNGVHNTFLFIKPGEKYIVNNIHNTFLSLEIENGSFISYDYKYFILSFDQFYNEQIN